VHGRALPLYERAFAVIMLFSKSICRYHALFKEHLPLPCSLQRAFAVTMLFATQRAFAVTMLFRITAMLFSSHYRYFSASFFCAVAKNNNMMNGIFFENRCFLVIFVLNLSLLHVVT
jgi:hypothetical protein